MEDSDAFEYVKIFDEIIDNFDKVLTNRRSIMLKLKRDNKPLYACLYKMSSEAGNIRLVLNFILFNKEYLPIIKLLECIPQLKFTPDRERSIKSLFLNCESGYAYGVRIRSWLAENEESRLQLTHLVNSGESLA